MRLPKFDLLEPPMIKPVDQSEIDEVMTRFYAAFDNRQGRAIGTRDLRNLFLSGARVTRVMGAQVDSWTVEEFIAPRAAMLSDGSLVDFHEWEVQGETSISGNIAERRSRYQKSGHLHGELYCGQGTKIIALCRLQGRWHIAALLWEDL